MDDSNVKVLVNHEEQYSLWPAFLDVPAGWTDTGVSGTKEECMSYVKEVWTDMRPLSLRQRMAESTATHA
ncbi:MbtH family protein [Micromonospora sp. LH3U1]|uniref:MbtH family protein n=1 Tax=Micromonospora sp. LH3U1 TaxID=3018339 RepID=UPI00234ACEF6|nr:MbtH family NRPS accessory protein [Micromonospora sp. LH3U1]WCN79534.1 MbtH family NRPS accessory protein [Micromonospora sp. LH3U1]